MGGIVQVYSDSNYVLLVEPCFQPGRLAALKAKGESLGDVKSKMTFAIRI